MKDFNKAFEDQVEEASRQVTAERVWKILTDAPVKEGPNLALTFITFLLHTLEEEMREQWLTEFEAASKLRSGDAALVSNKNDTTH